MCSFVVKHFSTFGVGDSDVIAIKQPPSPRAENDTQNIIGPVVGGVIGGIVFISIIAFFVAKMKRSKVQALEPKTTASENVLELQQQQQQISELNSATADLQQQIDMRQLGNQQQHQQTPKSSSALADLRQA
jgi:hypothetical protein